MFEEEIVVSSSLTVVAELEVAQRKVVEALSSSLWGCSEDLREQSSSFLLLWPGVGFYEAL